MIILGIIVFLFQLVYSPKSNIGSVNCIAQLGYTCINPIYLNSTANIVVTLGQNTGINWITANFVFVPQGTHINNGIPSISFTTFPANTIYSASQLNSGQTVILYLPVNGVTAPVRIGTPAIGTIWAKYTSSNQSSIQYVQIASINIKAS